MKEELLAVARGEKPADLRLSGAKIYDVFSASFFEADLYLFRGHVVGFEAREAREEKDLSGLFLLPGFIEAHLHLESSQLVPTELAPLLLASGTTTVICDPHEIANVLGQKGIYYLLSESERTPLSFLFTVPSCVPASPLETPGAVLGPDEVGELLREPRLIGLAEMMNFPATIAGKPEVLTKIRLAENQRRPIDGHAPSLSGRALEAYRLAGPSSDHECICLEEAQEKLRLGFRLFIRRGTVANNLPSLWPLVKPETSLFISLVSDDLSVCELLENGHLPRALREIISLGIAPEMALRLVTISPALAFGLSDRGAIFPGARADLVAVDGLRSLNPVLVWAQGRLVAKEGHYLGEKLPPGPWPTHPLKLPNRLNLRLTKKGERIRVIGLVPGSLLTETLIIPPTTRRGEVVPDPERDLAKIVCLERHHGTGNYSLGFVRGFGLKEGALASTVAHDTHHLLAVGMNDEDLLLAIKRIKQLGGGQVVVLKGQILAELPLPVGGLLSPLSAQEVAQKAKALRQAAQALGSRLEDPFMSLSFLALPVIPSLKITDQGLVDVEKFAFVDLFVD